MITTNLPTLKINKLTQAQYDRVLAAGDLDENALYLTPADSGNLKADSTYQVGDIVTTIRTDLGDSWLLCNGDSVDTATYSDLNNIFPPFKRPMSNKINVGLDYDVHCIAYANGYWVAGGTSQTYNSGTSAYTYYAKIAYATSLEGPWTTTTLGSLDGPYNKGVKSIVYANGQWVISGSWGNTTSAPPKIAYTSDPTTTWTSQTITGFSSIDYLTYNNGYWAIGGYYYSSTDETYTPKIAYTTDPSSTWTKKTPWSSGKVSSVDYINNQWVVAGVSEGSTYSYVLIAIATSLSSTWTTKYAQQVYNSTLDATPLVYFNGYYIIAYGYSSAQKNKIIYSSDLTSTGYWTKLPSSAFAYFTFVDIKCITTIDDYIVIGGEYHGEVDGNTAPVYAKFFYSFDIPSNWLPLAPISDDSTYRHNFIAQINGKFIIGSNTMAGGILYSSDLVTLPALSLGSAYSYMKVKED